jgi:hypothetical protein
LIHGKAEWAGSFISQQASSKAAFTYKEQKANGEKCLSSQGPRTVFFYPISFRGRLVCTLVVVGIRTQPRSALLVDQMTVCGYLEVSACIDFLVEEPLTIDRSRLVKNASQWFCMHLLTACS